ncbi:MAG: hypothetical protein HRU34_16015 [Richelia sp.]|nr:hypothetical protein [Richelia sp.]
MAEQKKDESKLIPKEFLTQLIFGLFLSVLLLSLKVQPAWSFFLGITSGFIFGWFNNVSQNNPKAQNLPSSEGIDAGLRYWLFFMLGLVLLGYQAPAGIFVGGIGGIAGGWMITWWKSKGETKSKPSLPEIAGVDGEELASSRTRITRNKIRKATQRYRRSPGSINWKFWEP